MDLRIEKTYRALLSAFTELLETHRYEDVTVAMLCDKAMIRRTTFYKHFADKAEFFTFFIDSLRMNLLKHGEAKGAGAHGVLRRNVRGSARRRSSELEEAAGRAEVSPDYDDIAILQGLVDFMLEHETLVDNIFKSSMTGMMMLVMTDKVAEAVRDRYAASFASGDGGAVTFDAASEFAGGGIVRMLQLWWSSGHSEEGERKLIAQSNEMIARVLGLEGAREPEFSAG